MSEWTLSSGHDPAALAVVDGLGKFKRYGPHYSRRTPGSHSFTGVGQEVVLLHRSGRAVWAVVRQRTPIPRGAGSTRGREGQATITSYVWRNMMFRNLYAGVASDLIRSALAATYVAWVEKYGSLPEERLRTEVDIRAVQSDEPGRVYRLAGWEMGPVRRGKLFLYAPLPSEVLT